MFFSLILTALNHPQISIKSHVKYSFMKPKQIIRGFPKVDHSGIDARIVLEQNKFTKKKQPLTGLEPSTLGL